MYVNVTVVRGAPSKVIIAPSTAVVHASYGDSVFVVEDKKGEGGAPVKGMDGKPAKVARQQFVRLGISRGDFVAVIDGIKAGQELVTAGAFKLRNGSGVIVNNSIKPSPSIQPHVDNL
jgi:membrane fusion protein (multidrug efflux system)